MFHVLLGFQKGKKNRLFVIEHGYAFREKRPYKDCIKDKFYGFKLGQVLEKLSITQKKSFETAAIKIYAELFEIMV
jgi:hypothetical protein